LSGNAADDRGLAFTVPSLLVRCTISNNFASSDGVAGGEYLDCTFSHNAGGPIGSAVNLGRCVNCLFTGSSTFSGSAPVQRGGPFINCTFTGTTVLSAPLINGTITNCILWGNSSTLPQSQWYGTGPITYSTLQNWTGGGAGNSAANPMLSASLHLLSGSPCIDSGDNSALPPGAFADLDGHARFFDAPEANSGAGTPPFVDRGCFEAGAPAFCYPNIDNSTTSPVLNVLDFSTFLNLFASGHPLANCDASTIPPVLNTSDFLCFLNKFTAGCS
jgi:hypothetical protein